MPLRYAFYVSECQTDTSGVAAVVAVARERNAMSALTGALVYTGGHFAQFLEGPPAALEDTLLRITHDGRHTRFTLLAEGVATERRFPQWHMALVEPVGVDDLLGELIGGGALPAARADKLITKLFSPPTPAAP